MTTSDEYLTAEHEADHGVFATMSGMDVRWCVLHAPGRQDEAGRVELYDWAEERDADIERWLAFLLAGRAAEYRAVGRYSERGAADLEHATLFAAVVLNTEASHPRVATLLGAAQLHVNTYMHDAVTWSWIERVARALITRRMLGGRDIQLLFREATP